MTIKLLLLKSGEDLIADVSEMVVGEDEKRRVIGYYLDKPCIIKMRNPNLLPDEREGDTQKAGYEVSLFPWMPLSKDETIPIPSDWMVTMVEPVNKLTELYNKKDVKNGQSNNKIDSADDSGSSDKSD